MQSASPDILQLQTICIAMSSVLVDKYCPYWWHGKAMEYFGQKKWLARSCASQEGGITGRDKLQLP